MSARPIALPPLTPKQLDKLMADASEALSRGARHAAHEVIALVGEVRELRREIERLEQAVRNARASRDAEWIAEFHRHFEHVQSVDALKRVFGNWNGAGVITAHVHEIWKRDARVVQGLDPEVRRLREENARLASLLVEVTDFVHAKGYRMPSHDMHFIKDSCNSWFCVRARMALPQREPGR